MNRSVPSRRRHFVRRVLRKEHLFAVALSLAVAFAHAQAGPVWAQLTVDQQAVLRSLQSRWDKLPEFQRTRLLEAAKRYPKLSSEQQRRFSQRLTQWASLSLEQRDQARDTYRRYAQMPKARQKQMRERWLAAHPGAQVATARVADQPIVAPDPGDSEK